MKRARHAVGILSLAAGLFGAAAAPAQLLGEGWWVVSNTGGCSAVKVDGISLLSSGAGAKASPTMELSAQVVTEAQTESAFADVPVGLITNTARALGGDPARIFEFVRNKISYVPYYGFLKGAERTLIDRAGNDLDQAWLLALLLNASGHASLLVQATNAAIPMASADLYDAPHWLGVTGSVTAVQQTLYDGGISNWTAGGGQYVCLNRFFTAFSTNGGTSWTYLDPAFKPSTLTGSLTVNVDTGLLFQAAGGTSTDSYVSNVSYSGLSAFLRDATINIGAQVWTQAPFAAAADVLPRWKILPESFAAITGNVVRMGVTGYVFYHVSITNPWKHSVNLIIGTNSYGYGMDEFASHKLWISYTNRTGSAPVAVFWQDDVPLLTETGQHSDTNMTLKIQVLHPYASANQEASYSLVRATNHVYVIPMGFGSDHAGGMREVAIRDMERLQGAGLPEGDPRLVSAALWVEGSAWHQVTDLHGRFSDWGSGREMVWHHNLGIAGQASSYYIDLKNRVATQKGGFEPWAYKHRMYVDSAMEHAVLEQIQGTNVPAVSTVRLLGYANDVGRRNYLITSNNTAVLGQLTNYTSAQLTYFQTNAQQGSRFFLPDNGALTVEQWTGSGYAEFAPDGRVGMMIGGGLNGGYNSKTAVIPSPKVGNAGLSFRVPAANIARPYSFDPVDLHSGAFVNDNADLSVDGPMPLTFSRHYRSDAQNRKGPMGWGWTHSYDIRAVVHSDVVAGLGGRTPQDMASALVGAAVLRDMMRVPENPLNEGVAALVARWMGERLTDNAVSITLGQQVITYILQPDGSYSPPPGMTMNLTRSNGVYVLSERNGNAYTFDASNRIARIDSPAGPYLTFTYSSDTNLTVESNFGQSIQITSSGGYVSSVKDGAQRIASYQYDSTGNLTNVVDPEGLSWRIGYDGEHRIVSMTDPMGTVTISNVYSSLGQVVRQTSASGHTWNQYSLSGVRGAEEDPHGGVVEYIYDDYGRTIRHRTADGAVMTMAYDGQNHVTNTVNALGVTNAIVYDAWHNVRMTIEAVGTAFARTTGLTYDDRHRLIYATNALGKVMQYAYDDANRPTLVRDPTGVTLTMAYGPSSGLLQTRSLTDGSDTLWTETHEYENGLPRTVAATDAGTVTTYYDAIGNLERVIDAGGRAVTNVYDRRRLVTTNATSAGRTTRTYWGNGLLKTTTDPRGFSTTNTWTAAYKPEAAFRPDGGSTLVEYDEADRPVRARDARGHWSTNRLDAVGRVTNSLAAYGANSFFFDEAGRMTGTVNAVAARTGFVLDLLGRRVAVVDPLLKTSGALYDALDQLRQSTNALARLRQFEYDDAGRPTATVRPSTAREETELDDWGRPSVFRDADGHVTEFVRDAQGRVKGVTDGAGVETKFRYDPSGVVTARWDEATGWTRFLHDGDGRLVDTVYSDGSHATLGYDAAGNVTTSCFGNVSQSFSYDTLNRLSVSIVRAGALAWTNGWGWDVNGNVTALTYPGGGTTVLGYDAEDRLDALTNNLAGGGIFQFRYDAAGRLTRIRYPNGVESTNMWDLADRLVEQRVGNGAFTNIVRRTIRDELGLPVRDEIDAGLLPVPTPDTWRRSVHDQGDRVLTATGMDGGVPASWAYSYDEAGNLLAAERTTTAGVSSVRYGYDRANRAVAVTSGASVASFVYDATGCRVSRTEGGDTRCFALDYADPFKRPLAELTGAGAVVRRYVWAGSLLLAVVESNGVVRYVHSDGQGSVIALTDAGGNVTDQWAWGPYGEPWGRTGTNDLSFTWLGGSGVRALGGGLYATHHRLYDANLRRFLQVDPLGIEGGANVYAYGNLNPLVFVDPLGLEAHSPSRGIVDRVRYAPDRAYDGRLGYVARTRGIAAAALLGISDLLGLSAIGEAFSATDFSTGKYLTSGEQRGRAVQAVVAVATYALPMVRVAPAARMGPVAARTGLATGADEAVFWSGVGRGGADRAASWAAQNGGATLESTLASRGIALPAWDASNPATVAAWREASIDFAVGARGNVRVLQGDALRVDAIWRDEFRTLRANPNVNSIRAINPNSGSEVLLWSR